VYKTLLYISYPGPYGWRRIVLAWIPPPVLSNMVQLSKVARWGLCIWKIGVFNVPAEEE